MSQNAIPPEPDYETLVEELQTVRRKGIVELRRLHLPELARAVAASGAGRDGRPISAPDIERLVRAAVDDMGGGRWGRVAAIMFGLAEGTRGDAPSLLRREAAEEFKPGGSFSNWRNNWERRVIGQIAEVIVSLCREYDMRLAQIESERRPPVATRLAVAWLERFEAYHRIWTPTYGLGADLVAYRSTLLEEDRPWDIDPSPDFPDGYTQELQATGYASYALFHFASHLAAVESFKTRFGGLWLLSGKQAEAEVMDAIAGIRLASPFSEQDDTHLRRIYGEVSFDLNQFRERESTDNILDDLHREWQAFVASCACTPESVVERGHFATAQTDAGISEICQLHEIVSSANAFCVIIDDDWDRIADWYHIGDRRPRGASASELYDDLRRRHVDQGVHQWPPWRVEEV